MLPRWLRWLVKKEIDQNFKREGQVLRVEIKPPSVRACFLQVRKFKSSSRRARAFTVGYKNRGAENERAAVLTEFT